MRRRLNISIPEDLHSDLVRIARTYGFRSACQMVATLVRVYVHRVLRAEDIPTVDVSAEEEIDDMFREFSDYEPTPHNTHVPVRRRKVR